MFTNIKAIIEFIKLLLDTYKFISGAISEAKYQKVVNARKKSYDAFITADRAERLRILRDENES